MEEDMVVQQNFVINLTLSSINIASQRFDESNKKNCATKLKLKRWRIYSESVSIWRDNKNRKQRKRAGKVNNPF